MMILAAAHLLCLIESMSLKMHQHRSAEQNDKLGGEPAVPFLEGALPRLVFEASTTMAVSQLLDMH